MNKELPQNDAIFAFSNAISWHELEQQKRNFNRTIEALRDDPKANELTGEELLQRLTEATGVPITTYYPLDSLDEGNVFLGNANGRQYVLGSVVSARYRSGHTLLESIAPYNLNPSVSHQNLAETEDPITRMRVLGAEIELGLVHRDGHSPTEAEMQTYMQAYYDHALRIGIYPRLDREACQYQVEAHIAPSIGYSKTRSALNGIFTALALASQETGLVTTIMSNYPTDSDFKMTDNAKVDTAVDLMLEVNGLVPEFKKRLEEAHTRYHITSPDSHYVNMFRIQGCHIHIDLAGRSEALGLLTFHTILKSASALANAAVLKGGPFVNGTCDAEYLCTRNYVRRTTITGGYLDLPTSPHLMPTGLDDYASLLKLEHANAVGRAMLYDDSFNERISVMHNPIGRIRPDLSTTKRVCTVESTGMPAHISASRLAAVLTDFEFSHAVIEQYFRKHGSNLEPMFEDKTMWSLLGPLDAETFLEMHDRSDREGSDAMIRTATGEEMTLSDFYERKRRFMHRALADIAEVTPRDIDEVYTSLSRMLAPPSGLSAQTPEEFIIDPKLRSTGNWGLILRNAYLEEGGVLGEHHPDAVLRVVNRVHDALIARYLQTT